MRISDWSSDVCCSDLVAHRHGADRRAGFAVGRAAVLGDARSGSGGRLPGGTRGGGERAAVRTAAVSRGGGGRGRGARMGDAASGSRARQIGRASGREGGGQYGWIAWVCVKLKKKTR